MADSTLDFADPVFLAILSVFLSAIAAAFGRSMYLMATAVVGSRLTGWKIIEFVSLTLILIALAVFIAWAWWTMTEF